MNLQQTNLDIQIARLDNELGFEVFKLSDSENQPLKFETLVRQTSKLDLYLTVFVLSGSGELLIDFEKYNIESGCFIFVSRGQLFKITRFNDLDAIIFKISEDFLSELFDGRGILPFARLFSYHHLSPLIGFSDNQYGGRKVIQAQSENLNKKLTLDIIRYYGEDASIIDNYAQACYDRIIPGVLPFALL